MFIASRRKFGGDCAKRGRLVVAGQQQHFVTFS
jgi:hypothetical protein